MQYRRYGKDGPEISRLGFGAMRLRARRKGDWGSVNYTRSVEVMRAAMNAGVNFIDTHHQYHGGKSEIAIGRALKGWKGPHITIQTKTPWYEDKPRAYFEKLLHEAVEKLDVDSIDYFLFHSMSMDAWKKKGRKFIRFTDWALARGLIRRRGFSSHETPENIRKFIRTGEFSAMLVSYNWMNPQEREVIGYAAERGLGVTVMNPIGGGTLASATGQIMRLLPGAKSAPEIALRYVLATPGVTAALSGMNTLQQVAENVTVAGRRTLMTAKQQRRMQTRLDRIAVESRRFCSACGYCMDCKHGVDIPANFRLLNQVRFFGLIESAKKRYARLRKAGDGDRSAEACRRCGVCEPKCPIKVPIIKQLQEVAATLGGA
jgi:hypothetical protein